jgi:hypothetical protein
MGKKTADSLMWGGIWGESAVYTLYLSNLHAISGHIVVKKLETPTVIKK